jgi:hypothetical protein
VKIKFQEGDRRVDSVGILIAKLADPGKVSLIQMRPEISDPVLEYAIRVVFVESFKKGNNMLLLFLGEERNRTTL